MHLEYLIKRGGYTKVKTKKSKINVARLTVEEYNIK